MPVHTKIGIIIYIVLIIQGTIAGTTLYLKAKRTPVLYSLLSCHAAMVLWLFFGILEDFSKETDLFNYAIRLTLLPIFFIGPLFIIFALLYIGMITVKRNKIIIFLILLPSAICFLPLLTDLYLNLVIYKFVINRGVTAWGLLFYVNTVISHIYFLISGILVIYKSVKEKMRIKQNVFLVMAVIFSALANILTGTKIVKSPGFDLVPISFSVVLAVISLLVFRYKIINIVPFAYNELFNQINSAVLIIDRDGNIDEYNSIFSDYFNKVMKKRSYFNINSFLDIISENTIDKSNIVHIKDFLKLKDAMVYEDTFRLNASDSELRRFTISIVTLKAAGRSIIGKLIVVKDVTKYMTETLTDERDRLSSDLHDSLGNCINIISSNLEYAIRHYDGEPEIKECLEVSYAKSTSAFLHLRRIVEELKPVDIENNGLLWALQSMFYKLRMKGLHIEFSHSNVNDRLLSSKKHGETIYYICQEAMSNSVIHGRADKIIITLIQTNNQVKLYITDDGIGCNKIIKNKGLNSMERRATTLGGILEYGSPSEGGFNLRVVIPIENEAIGG